MKKTSRMIELIKKDCMYFINRVDLLRNAIKRVEYDGFESTLDELDRIEMGYLNNDYYFLNMLLGGNCPIEYICEDFEGQLFDLEQSLYVRYPLVKQVRRELFEEMFVKSGEKSY